MRPHTSTREQDRTLVHFNVLVKVPVHLYSGIVHGTQGQGQRIVPALFGS